MTPLILAVDTTHEHGSLALTRGAELIGEVALHAPSGFAHVLYAAIRKLLASHSIRLSQIDVFAAASGPGSFTGVRVGLACIKGLAEAEGKPAAAVSNLEAIARFGAAPLSAALLDARRGEIYGAVYARDGGLVVPELVARLSDFVAMLPTSEIDFVSPDFTAFSDGLPAAPRVTAPRELAAVIGRIAGERRPSDPAALDANYVRRSDAELFWKE